MSITHAVIMIHGADNDASGFFDVASTSVAGEAGVLVIAPQFAEAHMSPAAGQLFWDNGWKQGELSSASLPWRISNFAVLDALITSLFSTFVNLDSMVVAGFSAGGQVVNRYAATKNDSRIRYAVGAPSSFMYFNDERDNGAGGWSVPVGCAGFNTYPYGLTGLNSHMAAVGATDLTDRYENNTVTYLVGGNDSDPAGSGLDLTCQADLQGNHRRERMETYLDYLDHFYGGSILTRHTLEVVTGFAHQGGSVYKSAQGKAALMNGA